MPDQQTSLSFSNDHVFKEVMVRSERICRGVLERILGVKIERIVHKEAEKTVAPAFGSHAIRMDVYVADGEGTVYDVEMQQALREHLPKRLRYYQASIDVGHLREGVPYERLPKSYIIVICVDFDPVGEGYSYYHFQHRCQHPGVAPLADDANVVICCARGTGGEVSGDYAALMRYIGGDRTVAEADGFIGEIDDAVGDLLHDDEWLGAHMRYECDMRDSYREGEEHGFKEGTEHGRDLVLSQNARLAEALRAAGRESELIEATLDPGRRAELLVEFGINAE